MTPTRPAMAAAVVAECDTVSGCSYTDDLDVGGALTVNDLMKLTPRTTAPMCMDGTVYYDSDDATFCFCEAGSFNPLDGVGACT